MKFFKGLLFSRDGDRAASVDIPTLCNPTNDHERVPTFAYILGDDAPIHKTWVTYEDNAGRSYKFLVVVQYRPECDVNVALKAIWPDSEWRGDVVVMRAGQYAFVVDMGGPHFKTLAERAVH